MKTYTSTLLVPRPLDEVFGWHQRPGALTRLTPHWAGRVVSEADSLVDGARASLRAAVPSSRGVLTLPWVSEQVATGQDFSFTDRLLKGPFKTWEHRHDFSARGTQTLIEDTVSYDPLVGLGAGQVEAFIAAMFAERNRRLLTDLDFQARYRQSPKVFVLSGASGLIGQQVRALLTGGGHTVRTLVRRRPAREGEFFWNPSTGEIDRSAFEGVHGVIHLGGRTISTRFTSKNRQEILESRTVSTGLLARTLADLAQDGGPQVFVCASAIGYYGAQGSGELLAEDSAAGRGFLAQVCQQWETATLPAREAGLRVVNVRTGVVQSALGGPLKLQLPLFLTGTGGAIGRGENMQSWVSLDDIAGIFVHAVLTDGLEGALNAVAPQPVTAKELAKSVGQTLGRPVFLPIPAFAPALLLKKEGAQELALADQQVSSAKLERSGYTFFAPDLASALRHELG